MQFTTLGAMLNSRDGCCIYCEKKFSKGNKGDFEWDKKANIEPKKKKGAVFGTPALGVDQPRVGNRLRKISMVVPVESKLNMTLSLVNNGLRIRGREKEHWVVRNEHVVCQNIRHYHAIEYSYQYNLYSMKYRELLLTGEDIRFKEKNRLYRVHLDWVTMRTDISDTDHSGKIHPKPNVLQFTTRDDLIQKIDRLMNLK
jgi:hypothetical protein